MADEIYGQADNDTLLGYGGADLIKKTGTTPFVGAMVTTLVTEVAMMTPCQGGMA